jgi:hypothetical protein
MYGKEVELYVVHGAKLVFPFETAHAPLRCDVSASCPHVKTEIFIAPNVPNSVAELPM